MSTLHCIRQSRRRGFWVADVVIAIGVVTVLTLALTTLVNRQNAAQRKLASSRAAVRLTEHALLNLQTGQPPPVPEKGDSLDVKFGQALDPQSTMRWVQVTAKVRGQTQTLVGPAPATQPLSTTKPVERIAP